VLLFYSVILSLKIDGMIPTSQVRRPSFHSPSSISTSSSLSDPRGPRKKNTNRTSSYVWKYVLSYPYCSKDVYCQLCVKDIPYGQSTKTVSSHFDHHHRDIVVQESREAITAPITAFFPTAELDVESQMLRFVVENYLPYSIVEDKYFRKLMVATNPKFQPCSSKKLISMVMHKADKFRTVIKNEIGSRYVMSDDCVFELLYLHQELLLTHTFFG
jgi:hypothetical protein